MSQPWFDANTYAWIPGAVFGTLGGCLGAVAGTLASTGKAKGLVLGTWCVFIAIAVLFLLISLFDLYVGQTYGIWYGFGLPGLLGVIVFPSLLPVILKRYGEAEQRKMQSEDIF